MNPVRYLALALLTLAPALALAQLPDSVLVVDDSEGYECPAYGAAFGARVHDETGPHDLVLTEPYDACESLTNADDVAGSIAFIFSGVCPYTEKVQRAVAAGAEAVVVINDDASNPDSLVVMEGECPPEVCSAPAVAISYNCGTTIIAEDPFGAQFTLIPIWVAPPVAVEEAGPEGAFVLGPAYPNPASALTTVGLDLPTSQVVRVAVFDVLGREVAVLHDGPLAAGRHTLALDAARLPVGLYLVRATVAGREVQHAVRRVVVTR